MKFEHTQVFNFEGAIRGMRNPLESWEKSDSFYCDRKTTDADCEKCPMYNDEKQCSQTIQYAQKTRNSFYVIGKNDFELMQSLIKAGSEHRKFLRQIFVSVDITAPLYWWKEFDTYKVGTVANSTSTMHKLASTPISKDCFEMGDFSDFRKINDIDEIYYFSEVDEFWEKEIKFLEKLRKKYNETKDKRYWKELIRLLPESWLQKRTVTMNYENLLGICSKGQRRNHKLTEWSVDFMNWARSLPYAKDLLFIDEE